jgi:hypothetical protein
VWSHDTLVFKSGFGNEASHDIANTATDDNTYQIAPQVFADFAAVKSATALIGHDIAIAATPFDTLTVKNKTIAAHGQNDFQLV